MRQRHGLAAERLSSSRLIMPPALTNGIAVASTTAHGTVVHLESLRKQLAVAFCGESAMLLHLGTWRGFSSNRIRR